MGGSAAASGRDGQDRATGPADVESARARILQVAGALFRDHGYDRTSLADVGAGAGITSSAVLYHFQSKANLLQVLLEPFKAGLDALLAQLESMDPPPPPAVILGDVLDLLANGRLAAELLGRDLIWKGAPGLGEWAGSRSRRLLRLISPGADTDPTAFIRGQAALGALVRPLTQLPDGPVGQQQREAVLSAALGALGPGLRRA